MRLYGLVLALLGRSVMPVRNLTPLGAETYLLDAQGDRGLECAPSHLLRALKCL